MRRRPQHRLRGKIMLPADSGISIRGQGLPTHLMARRIWFNGIHFTQAISCETMCLISILYTMSPLCRTRMGAVGCTRRMETKPDRPVNVNLAHRWGALSRKGKQRQTHQHQLQNTLKQTIPVPRWPNPVQGKQSKGRSHKEHYTLENKPEFQHFWKPNWKTQQP